MNGPIDELIEVGGILHPYNERDRAEEKEHGSDCPRTPLITQQSHKHRWGRRAANAELKNSSSRQGLQSYCWETCEMSNCPTYILERKTDFV